VSRPRKRNHIGQIEALLREAWRTLNHMPSSGIWPMGYKVAMPAVVQGRWDFSDAIDRWKANTRSGPTPDAVTRLDNVLAWVASADITAYHRELVWERAKGRMFKDLAYQLDLNERTVRRHYFKALAEICATAIVFQRRSLPVKTLSVRPDKLVA
jgi:hypothetical protein